MKKDFNWYLGLAIDFFDDYGFSFAYDYVWDLYHDDVITLDQLYLIFDEFDKLRNEME